MFLTENIKSGHRTNSWSRQGKNVPNIVSIPNYDALIQVLLNISAYFCAFWENVSQCYEFKPKSLQRTSSWGERGKNLPKSCQKLQIIVFVFF